MSFLNLSYAIIEFIAGGIFGSSAVLADSVHDLGDAIAIWYICPFRKRFPIVKKIDSTPLVTNVLVSLGAMLTAVILMIGSVLVILENVTKDRSPATR